MIVVGVVVLGRKALVEPVTGKVLIKSLSELISPYKAQLPLSELSFVSHVSEMISRVMLGMSLRSVSCVAGKVLLGEGAELGLGRESLDRQSAKYLHLLPVECECPGSGQVQNSVLNLLTIQLHQAYDLWEGSGVKDEPDLGLRCGAKHPQYQPVKGRAVHCFETPQAVQSMP